MSESSFITAIIIIIAITFASVAGMWLSVVLWKYKYKRLEKQARLKQKRLINMQKPKEQMVLHRRSAKHNLAGIKNAVQLLELHRLPNKTEEDEKKIRILEEEDEKLYLEAATLLSDLKFIKTQYDRTFLEALHACNNHINSGRLTLHMQTFISQRDFKLHPEAQQCILLLLFELVGTAYNITNSLEVFMTIRIKNKQLSIHYSDPVAARHTNAFDEAIEFAEEMMFDLIHRTETDVLLLLDIKGIRAEDIVT